MDLKRLGEKTRAKSIEKHDTAAWANVEKMKSISKVTMPSGEQVENAKEHADQNQK